MNSFRSEIYEQLVAIGRAAEIINRLEHWNMKPDISVYQTCADAADMVSLMEREHATLIGYSQGLEQRIDCLEAEVGWYREQVLKLNLYAGRKRR